MTMQESIVEIPDGSGNLYRYGYDPETQKTEYLGPVGDAPALSEEELMRLTPKTFTEERDILMKEGGLENRILAEYFTNWAWAMRKEGVDISTEMLIDWMKLSKKFNATDGYYLAIHKRLDPGFQSLGREKLESVVGIEWIELKWSMEKFELQKDDAYTKAIIKQAVPHLQEVHELSRVMIKFQNEVNSQRGVVSRIEDEDMVRWAKLLEHMPLVDAFVVGVHNYVDEQDKDTYSDIWDKMFVPPGVTPGVPYMESGRELVTKSARMAIEEYGFTEE